MYGLYVTGTSRRGQNSHKKKQERNWSKNYIKMCNVMSHNKNSRWWPSNENMTKNNHLKMTLTNKIYADTQWSNKIACFVWSSTVSFYWRITLKTSFQMGNFNKRAFSFLWTGAICGKMCPETCKPARKCSLWSHLNIVSKVVSNNFSTGHKEKYVDSDIT